MGITDNFIPVLEQLKPIDQLTDAQKRSLLENARIDHLDNGKRLPARNSQSWFIYLLKGHIHLIQNNEVIESIDTQNSKDSSRKLTPIFNNENVEFAISKEGADVLSIRRSTVEKHLREETNSDSETPPLNLAEGELMAGVYKAIQDGTLKLPSMPEVAVKVREITQKENAGTEDVAKVVQTDPVLAGRLIQAANSAAYRGARLVETVSEAVMRLGFKRSASLATSIALHGAFRCESEELKELLEDNWALSVDVSAIAFALAKHTRAIDPEQALLGGLVHRIGVVPLIAFAQKNRYSLPVIKTSAQRLTPILSGILLQEWQFERTYIEAANESENWNRNTGNAPDLADIIIVAGLYAQIRAEITTELPDLNTLPAFQKLGLGNLQSDRTLQALEDAAEEIASIREFLRN